MKLESALASLSIETVLDAGSNAGVIVKSGDSGREVEEVEAEVGISNIVAVAGSSVAVGELSVVLGGDSHIAMPISARPATDRIILIEGATDGITISFAFTPPPRTPMRNVTTPAIAKTIGTVISNFSLYDCLSWRSPTMN